ncbi:hypothetical protein [Paracoccus sp. (in: a-proteobacteria)]|uniref:hypothetical protein n=1 Tax=Paracoccus sp. TaxID=267 RepID=UPI003A8558E1
MILRSAILIGQIADDRAEIFDRFMQRKVVPALRRYPRIRKVTLRRHLERDDDCPPVLMQVDMLFDTFEDMRHALASQEWHDAHEVIASGFGDFRGTVTHMVCDLLVE